MSVGNAILMPHTEARLCQRPERTEKKRHSLGENKTRVIVAGQWDSHVLAGNG